MENGALVAIEHPYFVCASNQVDMPSASRRRTRAPAGEAEDQEGEDDVGAAPPKKKRRKKKVISSVEELIEHIEEMVSNSTLPTRPFPMHHKIVKFHQLLSKTKMTSTTILESSERNGNITLSVAEALNTFANSANRACGNVMQVIRRWLVKMEF